MDEYKKWLEERFNRIEDKINFVNVKMDIVEKNLSEKIDGHNIIIKEHDDKISSLEKHKNIAYGVVLFLTVIVLPIGIGVLYLY